MADFITCPSCQRRLKVPANVEAAGFTCPACLAKIQNPVTLITRGPGSPAFTPPAPSVPTSQALHTCPVCGEVTEESWGFCPHCRTDLVKPSRDTQPRRLAEHDVHRDVKRTGLGMILLAVLGGLGLIHLLFFGFAASRESGGDYTRVVVVLVFILFLGLMSTGIMFWQTQEQPSARGVGRVVVGTLALVGACISVLLASVIIFFVGCLVVLSGMK